MQPAQAPPRCTICNSPPINGQRTNFVLFDVALKLPLESKGLSFRIDWEVKPCVTSQTYSVTPDRALICENSPVVTQMSISVKSKIGLEQNFQSE